MRGDHYELDGFFDPNRSGARLQKRGHAADKPSEGAIQPGTSGDKRRFSIGCPAPGPQLVEPPVNPVITTIMPQ